MITRSRAISARALVAHSTTKSSAYLTSTPRWPLWSRQSSSRTDKATLANSGEIGEPCGVPDTVSVNTPSSNTPARSHARSSFSIRRSDTRVATRAIKAS